jgi:1-phosphofructokinase family hexose kinase
MIEFESLHKGSVNRALNATVGIGGKGPNTARMIAQLGGDPLLLGFAGGANGRLLERMLNAEGIAFRHVDVSGETRFCQTLIEAGKPEVTELVEEMPPLTSAEWEDMTAMLHAVDLSGMVTVSGKLGTGMPVDGYAQIVDLVGSQGGRVILDAPGEALLRSLEYRPFLVKINAVELLQTMGETDAWLAGHALVENGAQSVLITRGRYSAFYLDQDSALEIIPPKIDAINPVGSGDAVTAGMAVALNRDPDINDAIVNGMACGAANALNLVSGLVQPADVERLRLDVRMHPWTP